MSRRGDVEEARLERALASMAPVVERYDPLLRERSPGLALWRAAVADVQAGNLDDRPLYWARLRLGCMLRDRDESMAVAEPQSRGLLRTSDGDAPGILLTGFDPFRLDADIGQSNPSGLAALALDGTLISGSRVQSAILPVRYVDFDSGVVEDYLAGHFANGLDLAVTVSMGRDAFDLERFPGRRRSTTEPDNRGEYGGGSPKEPLPPPGLDGPEFLEFSLPGESMVRVGGRWPVRDNREVQTLRGLLTVRSLADLNGETAVSGSGGGYLSNEVAYRSLLLGRRLGVDFPIGHIHTPVLRGHDESLEGAIVDQIRRLIEAALP